MKKYLLVFILAIFLSFSFSANAQSNLGQSNPASSPCPPGSLCLDNPLGVSSPQALIGKVINSILGVVGSIALLMFVYGGLTWMLSSGNQEKVKKGRDIIVWSAIGLAVIFISYALTRLVLNMITT
ncbi:MAG: pilin [Patescibacteria group bacterium]